MNLNWKKKVELLGLEIPVLAIFLIGLGAAALLTSYGTITGTARVSQSVLLKAKKSDGTVIDTSSYDGNDPIKYCVAGESDATTCATAVAGNTYINGDWSEDSSSIGPTIHHYSIKNKAEEPALVSFETEYKKGGGSWVSSEPGITTSYQLVTSLLGKNAGEAKWTGTAKSGDYGVELTMPALDEQRWDVGGHVKIPVETRLNKIDSSELSFYVKEDTAISGTEPGTKNWWNPVKKRGPYYQIWVDLGPNADPEYRFQNLVPATWTVEDTDGWNKVTVPDSWYSFSWKKTPEGADTGPKSLSDWHSTLESSYSDYKVYFVSVQYGWKKTDYSSGDTSVIVDQMTFGNTTTTSIEHTWDLEQDDLQSLNLGEDPTLTIPPDKEKYDLTVTNDFAINLMPDTYTIKTGIKPA